MNVIVKAAELKVLSLKSRGNDAFSVGRIQRLGGGSNAKMKSACVLYGEAIEAVMELESYISDDTDQPILDLIYNAFALLRPTLFLNLAAANLILENPDGALKCCNSAIQLCNTPGLFLGALESADIESYVTEECQEFLKILMTKAFFRRGKCFQILGDPARAIGDYQTVEYLSPGNEEAKDAEQICLRSLQRSVYAHSPHIEHDGIVHRYDDGPVAVGIAPTNTYEEGSMYVPEELMKYSTVPPTVPSTVPSKESPKESPNKESTKEAPKEATIGPKESSKERSSSPKVSPKEHSLSVVEMTVNGGKSWLRRGYWSQTVVDSTMYIPISALTSSMNDERDNGGGAGDDDNNNDNNNNNNNNNNSSNNSSSGSSSNSTTNINDNKNENDNQTKYNAALNKYKIDFLSRSVTIKNLQNNKFTTLYLEHVIVSTECTWTLDLDSSILVLYFVKGPSFEWFPGQEWWDRVCIDDEAIDTTTCTIGADTPQLPQEARDRAQRESRRFESLSEEERAVEIGQLSKAKKDMYDSHLRTLQAANQEDSALEDVPERAAMMEAMRKEFPNINITAK